MAQSQYNISTNESAIATMSREELEAAYTQLQMTASHEIDQLRADRDFYQKEFEQCNQKLAQTTQKLVDKSKAASTLIKELQWVRDFIYNPGYTPSQKIAGISARDFCREGEPVRLFIGSMARRVGVASNTYSSALEGLENHGKITLDRRELERTEKELEGGEKEVIFNTPMWITFTKEFLEDPSIPVEKKKKNSGGNMKERSKLKEAAECPNCGKIHIKTGKYYECQDCGNEWKDKDTKDANEHRKVTAWNYADKNTDKEQTELFPVEEKPIPTLKVTTPKDYKGTYPPPSRRPFCHPDASWEWDDLIEIYTCERCHHG